MSNGFDQQAKGSYRRLLLIWFTVILTIRLVSFGATIVPWIAEISGALTAIILIYPPVIIGFMAKTDFDKGLKNMIEWYRENPLI